MNRLWSSAIVAAALAASTVGMGTVSAQSAASDLQLFDHRIAAYAELHQRVYAVFAPWAPTDDVSVLVRRRADLGSAIRAERADAKQGEIVDATAAAALREIMSDALRGVDVEVLLVDLYEGCETPAGYRPLVNGSYPDWATHQMPVALLMMLPVLPDGIQYRLIDHDLLLWDVDADVIIDVLPDALPDAGS